MRKTGCMAQRWSGSHKVHEWVPGWAIMSKGPKNFSDSFLAGRVVWMCSALTKTSEVRSGASAAVCRALITSLSFSHLSAELSM